MSVAARKSRVLATFLTKQTQIFVYARYDRRTRRYRIVWSNGPTVEQMKQIAENVDHDINPLSLSGMDWIRD